MKSGERPWKCRAVENEENQTQVSLVSPCLWKSLRDSHIPTAPATAVFLTGISIRKTQERSPAHRKPELYPFRLILGLENAPFLLQNHQVVRDLEAEEETR